MKKLLMMLCLIASITAKAQTKFDVCLSFNGYTGVYYLDRQGSQPIYRGKGLIDTVFSLTADTHVFEISGGYPFAGMNFTVDTAGKVNIATNPEAATVKDTVINGKKIAKIVFNTSKVVINPKGAKYRFSADLETAAHYQTSGKPKNFILIKGLAYMVSTGSIGMEIKMDSVIYGAEYFFFILQKDGLVAPLRAVFPNSLIAANYKKNEVSLNTIDIVFNPKFFKAYSMRLGGYESFYVKKSITLIRGLAGKSTQIDPHSPS